MHRLIWKLFVISAAAASILCGCQRHTHIEAERKEATYQQLRHVLGALQMAALDLQKTSDHFSVDDMIRIVEAENGKAFFRSEIQSESVLHVNPSVVNWLKPTPEIPAVYSSVEFVNPETGQTNLVAISFSGARLSLSHERKW